ncbi:hypothetical protein AX17_004946 [Amanita inopinata Kibby_2008]|nr:hypothetical protein AX17_004946 [Amanita inopinata Kibby_2008]
MACRSVKRAEAAKRELLGFLDAHIAMLKTRTDYDGHAEKFRKNLEIDIMYLDLADLGTVFAFANGMAAKYPYVSHFIFNAGLASFSRMHWPTAIKQVLLDPMNAVTQPAFYLQHTGELSIDGLGWVWQCNFFGHFVLFRALESLLSNSPFTSRVIWMSSLEASPAYYDPEDWQMKRNAHSYESTKYQIDIVAALLDKLAQRNLTHRRPRHFVAQPGICSTSIGKALVGPLLDMVKLMLFYVARLLGSPHHSIQPFKAAVSAVHLSLAPLAFISLISTALSTERPTPNASSNVVEAIPVRFGAETDKWGRERVGLTRVKEWKRYEVEAELLLAKCDTLFHKVRAAQVSKSTTESETRS